MKLSNFKTFAIHYAHAKVLGFKVDKVCTNAPKSVVEAYYRNLEMQGSIDRWTVSPIKKEIESLEELKQYTLLLINGNKLSKMSYEDMLIMYLADIF